VTTTLFGDCLMTFGTGIMVKYRLTILLQTSSKHNINYKHQGLKTLSSFHCKILQWWINLINQNLITLIGNQVPSQAIELVMGRSSKITIYHLAVW